MASAAEARRRGRPAPKGVMESFLETVDLSKHKDYLLREIVTGSGGTPPAVSRSFILRSVIFQAAPPPK